LTSERLLEVKEAVRRDLKREGLGFGVIASQGIDVRERGDEDEDHEDEHPKPANGGESTDVIPNGHVRPASVTDSEGQQTEPVKIIRIRSRSHSETSGRHRRPSAAAADEEDVVESDEDSYEHLMPFAVLSPEDPTGRRNGVEKVFVRRYKWGEIEVLNPEHCDFTPLRATLLGTNMKVCLRVF
jgi:hypothetical protein